MQVLQPALQLLLTLTGVMLLFASAQANGAMEALAKWTLRFCRGHAALLPPLFFLFAAAIAMVGPGAVMSTALVAPMAMPVGVRAGVPPFLIALMVGNGANAGNLSPVSSVGVIVAGLLERAGLPNHSFRLWFFHALIHLLMALIAYLLFGGLSLLRKDHSPAQPVESAPEPFAISRSQLASFAILLAWVVAVVFFRAPLGWSGLAATALIWLAGWSDWRRAVAKVPWKVIALVVSISTLVGLIESRGGLSWFQSAVAAITSSQSALAVVALLTGLISIYSSTSAVVLPAFLPMAPGLATTLSVDPIAMAIAMNIGSGLVDVSPLSTIGALCVAAVPPEAPPNASAKLFRSLTAWGFTMILVAGLFCWLCGPWFAP